MTYGWAVLVVLVTIGALSYYGVLNTRTLTPERCTFTPGVICKDYKVTAATGNQADIEFTIENKVGDNMIIANLGRINASTQCSTGGLCSALCCSTANTQGASNNCKAAPQLVNVTLQSGASDRWFCRGLISSGARGAKIKVNFDFTYRTPGTSSTRIVNGELIGQVQ
jgi:hypothetical protein